MNMEQKVKVLLVCNLDRFSPSFLDRCSEKFEIIINNDGNQGLEVFQRQSPFGIVIADLDIPFVSGLDVLFQVKLLNPATSKILLCEDVSDSRIVNAKEARQVDYAISANSSEEDDYQILLKAHSDYLENLEKASQYNDSCFGKLTHINKLATLGNLAANIGHELNNANHVFSMALDLIEMDLDEGVTITEDHIKDMRWVREQFIKQAEHLVVFGRPPADRIDLIDFGDAVTNALEILKDIGYTKRVNISTRFGEGNTLVKVSSTRLEQVLINLICNAVDSVSEDGAKSKDITISVMSEDKIVICYVEDTGITIPSAIKDNYYIPFISTKQPNKACGLGLPVSRHIIESYSGSLEILDKDKDGTIVKIMLPLAEEDE